MFIKKKKLNTFLFLSRYNINMDIYMEVLYYISINCVNHTKRNIGLLLLYNFKTLIKQ